ncbi:hypothetical protein C4565_04205 [Candidatus Parcubacteria bacterium]|jgi:hypothetical protein|nr:MAG: hypothetical protein C4565_04205 [Candidatus Parcubacteria bacterium]
MVKGKRFFRLSIAIQELFLLISEMNHLKQSKQTGIFVSVFNKETGDALMEQTFGLLHLDQEESYRVFCQQRAFWLFSHPDAICSIENGEDAFTGAVSGRKHVVAVSGLDPHDNSAVAILILSQLEDTQEDRDKRDAYVRMSECWDDLYIILDFLACVHKMDLFDRFNAV